MNGMPPGGPRRHFGPHAPLTEEEKLSKPKLTGALIKRILSYLRPYTGMLLLVCLIILISSILGLLPSILTGKIIDDGLIGGDFGQLLWLIGLSLAVTLVSNFVGMLESYLNAWIGQHITMDMKNQMYAHLQTMSHRFFTTRRQGDIITRMTSDIGGVQSVVANTMTNLLRQFAVLLTSVVALYQKNWILATVGLVLLPLFVLPARIVGRRRWMLASKTQDKMDLSNQMIGETLSVSGQMLVKLFCKENEEYRRFEKVNRETTDLLVRESLTGRWFRTSIDIFMAVGPMLLYLTGGILILRAGYTSLTVGDITVMVALLTRLFRPVDQLLNISVDITRSLALFSRIFEYLDIPAEIADKPDAVTPAKIDGAITFQNVGFSYVPDQPVLQNISFSVGKGRTAAVVGASGAGKSTLISLIPRLYDVQEGKILLDGIDIRDLSLSSLRGCIGLVTQDTYLFNSTIRENLLYAKPDATQEELDEACKRAYIYDFIQSLPQGYETLVGNRGLKLSGGEKQRVSIARVILKNPQILILDEATSSLDSVSENFIQQALDPLLADRTAIVIAHRLSTILSADEILVMQHGKLVECGTHEQLIHQNGVYRELYETQFRTAAEPL